jgi:hypothetical protein
MAKESGKKVDKEIKKIGADVDNGLKKLSK